MFVQCPSCSATYDLPAGSIAPPGRKVRCTVCKTMWQVEPPKADASIETPPSDATDDERFQADDLRLAGLDADPAADISGEAEKGPSPAVDAPDARRLRSEATVTDDPAIGADVEPDNSQDDIDALFGAPSVADYGKAEDLPPDEASHQSPEEIRPSKADEPVDEPTSFASSLASHARKTRQRMNSAALKPKRKIPLAAAASVAIFLGLGLCVVNRMPVVAAVPQTARLFAAIGLPVNLRGVEIKDVSSRILVEQGVPQLVVEGEIVNLQKSETKLSRLRFAVRSEKGQEIYSWKAAVDKPALAPGETLKFRRRLASPPDGASDVVVRFETHGDMIAGVQ